MENAEVFDFALSEEDMASLQFDVHEPVCWDLVNEVTNQIECPYD